MVTDPAGDLIVCVEVTDGLVVGRVAHLPQPVKEQRHTRVEDRVLAYRMSRPQPPLSWPALCGTNGWVYRYDGPIGKLPFCQSCMNLEVG